MIKKETSRSVFIFLLSMFLFIMSSCGPVVMTSRVSEPPPPWFYPNRLELVRYVYFPEYSFYYDLSARVYVYLDAGVWVKRNMLPPRYRHLDLRRTRYQRVKGYRSDNIQRYHEENNANRGRSNRTATKSNRTRTRTND